MRFFRLTQRRLLFLTLLLLLISSQLAPAPSRLLWAFPRHALTALLGLLSLPLKTFADSLRRPTPPALDRGDPTLLQRNYDALLTYCRRLESELARTRQELDRLRQLRQQPRWRTVDFISADVLAWSPDSPHPTLFINVGRRHGLDLGMIVTDEAVVSLLGRIASLGPSSATVELITSPRRRLEVKFKPSTPTSFSLEPPTFGIQADRTGLRFFLTAKLDAPVQPGWLAHLEDPAWPPEAQGLVVGFVQAVHPLETDPLRFLRVEVLPLHHPARLGRVMVVVPAEHASPSPAP